MKQADETRESHLTHLDKLTLFLLAFIGLALAKNATEDKKALDLVKETVEITGRLSVKN